MALGNTYDTKEEAEAAKGDYELRGEKAIIQRSPGGKWIVYLVKDEGRRKMSEAEAIAEGIRERRIERRIEEALEPVEEEEIQKETKRAARRLAVKKAMEKTPEEIERATLAQKKELLRELIDKRIRTGHKEPGVIVPVFDPETRQIIDYKLATRGFKQKLKEEAEEELRTGAKQKAIVRFAKGEAETVLRTMRERGVSVKAGMQKAIPTTTGRHPRIFGEGMTRIAGEPGVARIAQSPSDARIAVSPRIAKVAASPGEPDIVIQPSKPKIASWSPRPTKLTAVPYFKGKREKEEEKEGEKQL